MATIKYEEYPVKDNGFEYLDTHYDCEFAIKKDVKRIIQEAESSHKDEFENFYDKDSLVADKVRLFTDDSNIPIYGMIIYKIYNKSGYWRIACGNYYPVNDLHLEPHFFQASICW